MKRYSAFLRDGRGSMAVMTALMMALFVGLLGIVTDLGHVQNVHNELRNAADAAALAGARALYPQDFGTYVQEVQNPDCASALTMAANTVRANWADKGIISQIGANDIQYGRWDVQTNTFTPQGACVRETNAVRVVTRKDPSANEPVSTTFARIFRQDVAVTAEAVAYISWAGVVPENQCILPIGIPVCSGDPQPCPYPVKFSPDNTDTATWHTFTIPNASADQLRRLLQDCRLPSDLIACPPSTTPTAIEVNNGQINSVLQAMWDIFIQVINDPSHPEYATRDIIDPMTGETIPNMPVWRRSIIKLSCGEGPCEVEPGSISDWKAVQQLWFKGVYCFDVYDMKAAGRNDPNGIYPLDKDENQGYVTGCINENCAGNYGGGGGGTVTAVLPVLVK